MFFFLVQEKTALCCNEVFNIIKAITTHGTVSITLSEGIPYLSSRIIEKITLVNG
jgi:hypothetical protein